jgi:hypothetical protein
MAELRVVHGSGGGPDRPGRPAGPIAARIGGTCPECTGRDVIASVVGPAVLVCPNCGWTCRPEPVCRCGAVFAAGRSWVWVVVPGAPAVLPACTHQCALLLLLELLQAGVLLPASVEPLPPVPGDDGPGGGG